MRRNYINSVVRPVGHSDTADRWRYWADAHGSQNVTDTLLRSELAVAGQLRINTGSLASLSAQVRACEAASSCV